MSATMMMNESSRHAIEHGIVALTPALQAFARRFVRTQDDIDDLVQETLLKAIRAIDHYQPGTALKSWLFTIMRNTFCTNYARRRREPVEPDNATWDVATAPAQEWSARRHELQVAMNGLPENQRRALMLVALGSSYEETAEICGCRVGTIKSRVNRARQDLIVALGEQRMDASVVC